MLIQIDLKGKANSTEHANVIVIARRKFYDLYGLLLHKNVKEFRHSGI